MSRNVNRSPDGEPDPQRASEQIEAELEAGISDIDTEAEAEAVVDKVVKEGKDKTAQEAVEERPTSAAKATRARIEQDEVEEAAATIEKTAAEAATLEEDDEAAEEAIEQAVQNRFWREDKDYKPPRRLLLDAFLRHRSMPYLQRLDAEIFLLINEKFPHPSFLNRFFRWIALIFRNGWAWQIGILCFLPFRPRRTWQVLKWAVPSIYLAAFVVEQPVKHYFRRRRPFLRVVRSVIIGGKPSSWSFPSGHSAAAFAGAHALSKLIPGWRPLWYAIAALVGFCRIYLGAHYPSDVTIGSLFGVGLTEMAFWILRRLGLKEE